MASARSGAMVGLGRRVSPLVYDPYDLWSTSWGVGIRERFYKDTLVGKGAALGVSVVDWLMPSMARSVLRSQQREYAITCAQLVLKFKMEGNLDESVAGHALDTFEDTQLGMADGYSSWGLRFAWMSKNGLYDSDVPTVTQTPYVLEALLEIAATIPAERDRAMNLFNRTLGFLDALHIMHSAPTEEALSYAPRPDPRLVYNANAYAALCLALHAVHGRLQRRQECRDRASRIVTWILRGQRDDGAWFYYADNERGNFIDCFHSCFVIKNLNKVATLLPELSPAISSAARRGYQYLRLTFVDETTGLCRRFAVRDFHDPYRWDIYDQAEYLGLLVGFGDLSEGDLLAARVERYFRQGDDWWCRIDVLGRRWGKNFLRWGIAPFWYHRARLNAASGAC